MYQRAMIAYDTSVQKAAIVEVSHGSLKYILVDIERQCYDFYCNACHFFLVAM